MLDRGPKVMFLPQHISYKVTDVIWRLQSLSMTLGYNGLAFDLTLTGPVKSHAIVPKGRTVPS